MYTYKIHILSMHTILLLNMINHTIHISNYLIKQLKNIIILLITFLMKIFLYFHKFRSILDLSIFFSKISIDISVITNIFIIVEVFEDT